MPTLADLNPMTWAFKLQVAGLCAVAAIGGAAWLYAAGSHHATQKLTPVIEQKADDAAARGLEAKGAQDSTVRTEATLHRAAHVQETTHALTAEVRASRAADQPLDAAAAHRLQLHDRILCASDPEACSPAASGDAVDGLY